MGTYFLVNNRSGKPVHDPVGVLGITWTMSNHADSCAATM
jgi:hypothetical protein